MQIVIDIPKHIYEHIREVYEHSQVVEATYSYIYHGTPIPKHGRLIDADKATICCLEHTGKRSLLIDLAPTVIEADVTDMNVGKKEE